MGQDQYDSSMDTHVLPVNVDNIGTFVFKEPELEFLGDWDVQLRQDSDDAANLLQAVEQLQTTNVPVAFPTETVYGLGANATRDDAVAGIYKAKRRPADNPLIVHVSSLTQLRHILMSSLSMQKPSSGGETNDPIPAIYHPLISRFWPGPLTILLPLPEPSPLARSVTGDLSTFGVRMPSSRLALALIHLARLPIAAPSANASTKPSPTTAAHVLHDLSGRIKLIIDGGPCLVGVESTVVDGLVSPPVVLRPGGVSLEMLRLCAGWEDTEVAYRDVADADTSAPRAPGMKYKHYSPAARVILVKGPLSLELVTTYLGRGSNVGIAKTGSWRDEDLAATEEFISTPFPTGESSLRKYRIERRAKPSSANDHCVTPMAGRASKDEEHAENLSIVSTHLGNEATSVAKNLFSALRELDLQCVDVIFVEAIDVSEGHAAAAVMNRLQKAAELEV
ncbi:MAG: hypothetical protein Q9170_000702 [Blastenia crenularia]